MKYRRYDYDKTDVRLHNIFMIVFGCTLLAVSSSESWGLYGHTIAAYVVLQYMLMSD